jgi:hypothetical protein
MLATGFEIFRIFLPTFRAAGCFTFGHCVHPMNVTNSLQTILCAGVTHFVLPRGTTKLLPAQNKGQLVIRERVRLKQALGRSRPGAEQGRQPLFIVEGES